MLASLVDLRFSYLLPSIFYRPTLRDIDGGSKMKIGYVATNGVVVNGRRTTSAHPPRQFRRPSITSRTLVARWTHRETHPTRARHRCEFGATNGRGFIAWRSAGRCPLTSARAACRRPESGSLKIGRRHRSPPSLLRKMRRPCAKRGISPIASWSRTPEISAVSIICSR